MQDSFGLSGGEEVDRCVDSTKVGFHEGAMKNRLRRALLAPPNSKWRNLTFVAAGSSVTAGAPTRRWKRRDVHPGGDTLIGTRMGRASESCEHGKRLIRRRKRPWPVC